LSRRITCVWIGFWASTPVCGPHPKAPGRHVATADLSGPFLPWASPLSGMRAQSVHSDGLDPARIIKPWRRYPRRPSARGLTFASSPRRSSRWLRRELPFSVFRPDALPLRAIRCPDRASCLRFCTCRERDARHRDSRRGAQPPGLRGAKPTSLAQPFPSHLGLSLRRAASIC
jgi:hypothetical protein